MNKRQRGVLCLTVCILILLLPVARAQGQLFDRTDTQKEIEVGRAVAKQIEAEEPLSKNPAMWLRVKRIGVALVTAMPQKAYPYEFKVLANPEFNAHCLPGGFMYVNEGLLNRLPDDNAVAWVMGHELTHAAHRHWARALQKLSGETAFGIVIDVLTRSSSGSNTVLLRSLRFSRDQETDADKTGLELAWAAGYDPHGAEVAAGIMADMEKESHVPAYLRDHPLGKDRLAMMHSLSDDLARRTRPTLPKAEDAPPPPDIAAMVGKLPDVVPAANPWYPLAVGNEWTYEVKGSGGLSSYTIRIASLLILPKGSAYRAMTVISKKEIPFQVLTEEGSVWRRNRPTSESSSWEAEYITTLQNGIPKDDGSTTFTLLGPEAVSTAAGNFTDVLKLRKKTTTHTSDIWFARGVGLVKTYCADTGITETLTAYHIAR